MYRHPLIHKPHSPKLWEEEWDPTELDFINNDEETIPDTNIISMKRIVVRRMIRDLNPIQRKVIEAFMAGQTHAKIGVTEKHWRYHLGKALETMRNKLVDTPHQLKVKYDFNRRNYEQHH